MRHYRTLLFLICAIAAPVAALAQTAATALHGTITDPSGAVISKAKLSIVNPDTGFKAEHISSEHGEYAFEQITPGTYTVLAEAPGFAPQKQIVELLVNQPRTIDFKLGVASSTAETVEVVDTLSALNTNDATVGTPFDTKQIQALPFEGNNVLDLLSLQAGVLFLGDKTTQQQDTDSRSGAVDGARSDQSNVTLDGLDDNDQNKGYAFSGVLRSTRDSVEEFRVVTTNANADSGRSSGAQVALVTRGGTNKFHGSAYGYYRPTNTVANDWFNKQAELSSGLPNVPGKLLRNTFGGSFGAPIKKDRLFGFVAYEGQRTAESAQQTRGVPTDSLRAGNVIYNTSSCDSGTTAVNCSGNTVTLHGSQHRLTRHGSSLLLARHLPAPGPGVDPAAMMTYLRATASRQRRTDRRRRQPCLLHLCLAQPHQPQHPHRQARLHPQRSPSPLRPRQSPGRSHLRPYPVSRRAAQLHHRGQLQGHRRRRHLDHLTLHRRQLPLRLCAPGLR